MSKHDEMNADDMVMSTGNSEREPDFSMARLRSRFSRLALLALERNAFIERECFNWWRTSELELLVRREVPVDEETGGRRVLRFASD